MILTNKNLNRLKSDYPPGQKVRLICMDDSQAPPPGTTGTVRCVDDIGTIHVDWENGSSLGVVFPVDRIEKIK